MFRVTNVLIWVKFSYAIRLIMPFSPSSAAAPGSSRNIPVRIPTLGIICSWGCKYVGPMNRGSCSLISQFYFGCFPDPANKSPRTSSGHSWGVPLLRGTYPRKHSFFKTSHKFARRHEILLPMKDKLVINEEWKWSGGTFIRRRWSLKEIYIY